VSRWLAAAKVLTAVFALPLAGCATSLTMERISPSSGQSDFVAEVKSAHRQPSGAVVICVVGRPAQTPFPFKSWDTPFSLTLPADASVTVRKSVRYEMAQFQVSAANVGDACPQHIAPATEVLVRRIEPIADGDFSPDHDQFIALVGSDAESAGVWTAYTGFTRVYYVSEAPRFAGRRAVEIKTGDREIAGQPAYLALLPFALVFDVLMSPIYLLWALAGGPHGR